MSEEGAGGRRGGRRARWLVLLTTGCAGTALLAGLLLTGDGRSVGSASLTSTAGPTAGPGADATASATSRPVPPPTPATEQAAPPEPAPLLGVDAEQAAALRALLATRGEALRSGDRAAWLGTVDPDATAFRARQARVLDNAREVPFAAVDLRVASLATGPSAQRRRELGAPAVLVRVLAGYRLPGDRADAEVEQQLTCVQRGGRWYVASDTDGPTQPQPWDLGPVHVVADGGVLALGTAPRAQVATYASVGAASVRRVTSVWGSSWPQRAVVVVPRDQAEMARLLQRTDVDGLDQVAAITIGELPEAGGPAGSDRVVVNPAALARLTPAGRRVVVTHELTHVAVRSSTDRPVPVWLSEGFAEYVGYLGVNIGRAAVAARLLELTRVGRGFTSLPTADDFDASRAVIAPAYSASWLACTLVVDRYGQAALVRLYRTAADAGDGSDPDTAASAALESVLGATEPAFTSAWVQYVDRLAGRAR